jgi:hypothetical protein
MRCVIVVCVESGLQLLHGRDTMGSSSRGSGGVKLEQRWRLRNPWGWHGSGHSRTERVISRGALHRGPAARPTVGHRTSAVRNPELPFDSRRTGFVSQESDER